MMRTRTRGLMVMMVALLLASGVAWAQQTPQQSTSSGTVAAGVVGSDVSGDEARFQRYRDVRGGGHGGPFRVNLENSDWVLNLAADSVGRRDQRYFAELEQQGKVSVSFEWNEIPLFYSDTTRSLYNSTSPGVLRIDDNIQQGIEDGLFGLPDVIGGAGRFDTRSGRDVAAFDVSFLPRPDLDVNLELETWKRDGLQPWGASFGFNAAVEVPVPVDDRTTDVGVGLEWANQNGLLRVDYDASVYDNNVQTLVWDSPFKLNDSTNSRAYVAGDGTSQGRMALWPSNTSHTVTTTGSIKLPGRSRFTGTFAVGTRDQNESILPHTINSAIEPVHLDRTTAQAEVRTLATNLSFTSRPNRYVRVNAKYRYFDFDNRTPVFDGEEYVRFDQVLEEGGGHSEPFDIKRQSFDADVSFSPVAFTSFRVGYGYGKADRTFRIFPQTTEHIFRVGFDSIGHQYFSLRTKYEHSQRDGSDFDVHLLEEVGEQPGMRHYDVANRNRDRFTTVFTLTPLDYVGVNFSVAVGQDKFDDSEFGLQDNKHRVFTVGFDASPFDAAGYGLYYVYENYTTLQNSRAASPGAQFEDPTRDFATDADDEVHTFGGYLDLLKLASKVDVRFGYDYSKAESLYVYAVGSGLPTPDQLPPVKNDLHRGTIDADYWLTEQLAVGVVYWFDKYVVDDFALDGGTGLTPSGGLLLGYFYEPYTVHTGWLRLLYSW